MKLGKKESGDARAVSALRVLALDTIQNAGSGHPGMALDAAPALYTLFAHHMLIDPKNPDWDCRDRFVLSSGHASALLYSLLFMAGYDLSLDDLRRFRQLGSRTPGHPEYGHTPGVDATAGPLGQGIAQAVGMAMAEKHLSAQYPSGEEYITHKTYVLCGDGCLEEGISQEAISLAGNLGLNNLVLIYDRNGSTLDAPTSVSMGDDAELRFLSAGWNVINVRDGNDLRALNRAISKAKKAKASPTAIIMDTVIGYGTPLAGSHKVHGSLLGAEDYEKTRAFFGADYGPFGIPGECVRHMRSLIAARLSEAKPGKEAARESFLANDPKAKDYLCGLNRDLGPYLPVPPAEEKAEASRNVSGRIVAELGQKVPFFFGGSADVAGSVKTAIPGDPGFSRDHPEGKDVSYGIREFAMAAVNNGILLHKGLACYGGCFLVFSDYLKPAIRMAALEGLPNVFLFSHDSLAVGEDGPTHEPVEQLSMLRSIPGLVTIRPADERETYYAWRYALQSPDHPVALVLSRQKLAAIQNTGEEGFLKGCYRVYAPKAKIAPAGEILASGSEVGLAIEAAERLETEGIYVDVLSFPSFELFERAPEEYRSTVFAVERERRVSLEMAATFGWGKYAATNIGVDSYGASGKEKDVLKAYGFTPEEVARRVKEALKA